MIYWILQDNQVTGPLLSFLQTIQLRASNISDIRIAISSECKEIPDAVKHLNPITYAVNGFKHDQVRENIERKRRAIVGKFSDGLAYRDVLIQDDFGGDRLFRAEIDLDIDGADAIFLQIPTPLGSYELEERIFYAWVYYAKSKAVPVIGYELLPLATRWTFVADLLDGVITSREESCVNIGNSRIDKDKNLWLLPPHEGRFFSASTPNLWSAGLKSVYHYQDELKLRNKAVICIPHNVALTYEYKDLIDTLNNIPDLHYMFIVGPDQMRNGYTQQEIIEKVCGDRLQSCSFHDLNAFWEMAMAACVVACSECHTTQLAQVNNIPAVIYDPYVMRSQSGSKFVTGDKQELLTRVEVIVNSWRECTELTKIIARITHAKRNGVHSTAAS